MSPNLLALILLSVSLSALAQLALKAGTGAVAAARPATVAGELGALAQSPMVYLGLALYGLGAAVWLFVLARAPLSLAYPFVGLGFILTMFAGSLAFQEEIGAARLAGTLLIAVGCVLVARSA